MFHCAKCAASVASLMFIDLAHYCYLPTGQRGLEKMTPPKLAGSKCWMESSGPTPESLI